MDVVAAIVFIYLAGEIVRDRLDRLHLDVARLHDIWTSRDTFTDSVALLDPETLHPVRGHEHEVPGFVGAEFGG